MKVSDYLEIAEKTDNLEPLEPDNTNYKIAPIWGLAGEIGELLTELKKMVREPDRIDRESKKRIKEELGDILWYTATIARRAGLNFQSDVLFANLQRVAENPGLYLPLVDDDDAPGKELQEAIKKDGERTVETFKSYQDHAAKSAMFDKRDEAIVVYLGRIWKNSGELLEELELDTPDFSKEERQIVSQTLGDVLWYVAGFATLYDLNLNDIAEENSKKAWSKFAPGGERVPTSPYDIDFPPREQFPRQFDVIFAPAPSNDEQAVMLINGFRIGNPLRDNAYQPVSDDESSGMDASGQELNRVPEIEGYRFHDAIHFAFVAILGWSPVMRGLMRFKRKKRKEIDDAEDGARAQIVEEMIVKLAHSYLERLAPPLYWPIVSSGPKSLI